MLSLADYCEENGLVYNNTYQSVYHAEKRGLPYWIEKQKSTYYIDEVKLAKKLSEEQCTWAFATTYTYWWMHDWMKMKDKEIAVEMAKRSKTFTSESSWTMFINKHLFNMPTHSIYEDKRRMVQDFVVYGTAMCLAYYRDNY